MKLYDKNKCDRQRFRSQWLGSISGGGGNIVNGSYSFPNLLTKRNFHLYVIGHIGLGYKLSCLNGIGSSFLGRIPFLRF